MIKRIGENFKRKSEKKQGFIQPSQRVGINMDNDSNKRWSFMGNTELLQMW